MSFLLTGCSLSSGLEGTKVSKADAEKETVDAGEIQKSIEEQIASLSPTVTITGLIQADAKKAFEECRSVHPEYFWLKNSYSYVSDKDSKTTTITLDYAYDVAEIPAMQEKFNAVADAVIAETQTKEGDFYKALYAHDYITDHTSYSDEDAQKAIEDNEAFVEGSTAYGCLVNGSAICGGYTNAYMYILNKCGIECSTVTGLDPEDDTPHIWNVVKMDGEYYHVDVTWDDPSRVGEEIDLKTYIYFGITTDEVLETHRIDNNQDVPVCTAGSCNYHIHEGYYMNEYNQDAVASILKEQFDKQNYASVKFGSNDCVKQTIEDFVKGEKIFDVAGRQNLMYSETGLVFLAYRVQ